MNSVIINNKSVNLPNPFEIENFISNFSISQEEFFYKLKKDIESLYYAIFKNTDYHSRLLFFIQSQILIDKSYKYLLEKKDSEKYSKDWKISRLEIDKVLSTYKSNGSYENTYQFEFPGENEDYMLFFYKFSFSTFFGEKYLQNLFDMCPNAFKENHFNHDDVKKLHLKLKENFKKDYDKAYNLFKNSL